jgi:hypothetical protein
MSEKHTAATRPVPKSDGLQKGGSYTTLTTPNDREGKVWSKGNETGKIMSK